MREIPRNIVQERMARMLFGADIEKSPIEKSPIDMSPIWPEKKSSPDIFTGYEYYDIYIPRSFYYIENGPSLWEILKAFCLTNPEKLMAINLSMEVIDRHTKKRYCLNVCRIKRVDSICRQGFNVFCQDFNNVCVSDPIIPYNAGIFDFFVDIECNGEISNAMFQYNLDTRTGSFSSNCDPLKFMQAVS